MSKISRMVKNALSIVPIVGCLFLFGGEQRTSANITEQIQVSSSVSQTINQGTNQGISQGINQEVSNEANRFGFVVTNSFGVHIDGCYYQVEQFIDGISGNLYCGTLIVFCQNSVEIYTGGSNCS